MSLFDKFRKPKPKSVPQVADLASPEEFITDILLGADLPLPQSKQEEARNTANGLAVSIFRNIYSQQQTGPSPEMSDALILGIYRRVGCAFREVSKDRGDFIESAVINVIVLKFLEIYRSAGPGFFDEHLQYEISKYKAEGLRADYSQKPLHLFR